MVNLNSELILVSNIRDKDKVYKKTFPLWEISTDSLTIDKLKFMHEKKAIEDKYYSSSKYETGNEIYFIGKSKIEGYNSFENYIYIFKK